MVCEYTDVFLDELSGMPLDCDMEFVIGLIPETAPMSKRPYQMASDKMAELKQQLKVQLDKGFIHPRSSP